jgi:hypothetical protein
MTAAWPGTIPQKPLVGFAEQRQRNVASFNPDVGEPKVRRRSTAVTINCNAQFIMTDLQLVDFITFFETTLSDGTLPFTWAHPRTGVTYTWMFGVEDSPTIEATTYNINTVSCRLIRLPV